VAELTAFFDANIFYPAPLRDFMVQFAKDAMLRARWTNLVHEEWISALLRNSPELDRSQLERARKLMDNAIRDCLVEGYEHLIPTLTLPDPNDRHILAAAIHCRADVIVTQNLRDFPASELSNYRIRAQHPDDFIFELMGREVVETARKRRANLEIEGYPQTVDEYLATLKRNGLAQVAAELGKHRSAL